MVEGGALFPDHAGRLPQALFQALRIDWRSLAAAFFAVEISFQRCNYRVAHGSDLSREGIITEGSCLSRIEEVIPASKN